MAGANSLSQLRAILTKNLLLKWARKWGTLAEIALPVLFMALLILIKEITTLYDSPNVAYSCGNTFPWYGSEVSTYPEVPDLIECGVKPDTCDAKNYYRSGWKQEWGGEKFRFSSELGFVTSADGFPYFTYMVQDNTTFVNGDESWYKNPSLPFDAIIDRLADSRSLLAVTSHSGALDTEVTALHNHLQSLAKPESAHAIKTFASEKDLEKYTTNSKYEEDDYRDGKVWGALVLLSTEDQQWSYKIRLNFTYDWEGHDGMVGCLYGDCELTYPLPDTRDSTFDLYKPYEMSEIYGYGFSGFLTLQQVMDQYILKVETGTDVQMTSSISMMPTPAYISDDFQYAISEVLGIFYMLSYLYPVAQMVRGLVLDKEERLKEGMRMMGLSESAYNTSWLITLMTQLTLVSGLITLITGDTVFEFSDKSYVFLFFFAFSMAIMCFCFLMASVFQKAKTAALLGPLLFFATFFPSYAVDDDNFSTDTKQWVCLLAPSCFAMGANVFAEFEGGLVGVQESNLDTKVGNLSYNIIVTMLFVDAVVYGVLAWYLDKVFPSEFGTPLPWYFPVTKSYWCGTPVGAAITGDVEDNTPNLEPVSHEFRRQIEEQRGVQIRGLRKVFKTTGEDRVAVKNLNMELYEGQITVLLGHNGAGKSTTISMLSGLIPPTAGDAIVRGRSIISDMHTVRNTLGVCPQHNVLFPELTVMQHLRMYATFKGMPAEQIDQAARTMIAEVGLLEKANVPSGMLSGGMKRKLSLGIALIGDSKVVILDEPTSGMDPYSRRSTWNVLQRNKRGRVILLTTHFMDEADYLGDRIAIMAAGQLKCFGSSLYLKNKYGVGYTLTIVRNEGPNHTAELEKLVTTHVPSAEVLSNVGAELSFRLPFAASSGFTQLFADLDSSKRELNFAQYGISITTLEEVFMRVGHEAHEEQKKSKAAQEHKPKSNGASNREVSPKSIEPLSIEDGHANGNGNGNGTSPGRRSSNVFWSERKGRESEMKVFLTHFMALLRKRAINGIRDKKMVVCQLVLPTLLVATGLGLLQIAPSYELPKMRLAPFRQNPDLDKQYRDPVPIYAGNAFGQQIADMFDAEHSYGYAVEFESYDDQFSGCHQGAVPLQEMSNFLIATRKTKGEKGASRYGAVTISNTSDAQSLEYNVMVNGSSAHGAAIYPNQVHQAALQALTGNPNARITAYSHPLPRTYKQERDETSFSAFTVSLFMMIAFCFIPASYAMFVVKEREVKAKHQQIISGVSIPAYWTSTFAWDAVSYLFPCGVVMILIAAFDVEAYLEGDGGAAAFLIILLYGPSTAAFTYMISFLFNSHSTAQNIVMFFNFITGLCLMVVSFVLSVIPSTTEIAYNLRFLFRLFPAFCLGDGLMQLALCQDGECMKLTTQGYTMDMVGVFHWDVATGDIVYMAVGTVVYMGIVFLIEYLLSFPKILGWLQYTRDPGLKDEVEDDDVAAERQRIARGDAVGEVVCINSLRKVYPSKLGPKVAVQSLSFGIPKGECFGFLGINGAGKTTTLSILSGEFPPTSGSAHIAGYDILTDQTKIRRKIGYCPQFDALLELLTVREHLQLYARIKGIPEDVLEEVVEQKIQQMDLTDFANKAAGSLSGGNKRKLSVAIAIIGEPSIVFLDEPSTGMDPVARRFMWDVIAQISTRDRSTSIILTTHSMEEAEALCSRIGIMVNGRLRCLGSSTHLKNKFGSGYEVDIRTRMADNEEMLKMAGQLIQARTIEVAEGTDPLKAQIRAPFDTVATVLGNASRANEIAPGRSGALLYDALMADGHLKLQSFLEWWLAEDFADSVDKFINSEFDPQVVMLVERSTAHSFRYRINDASLSLSQMFGKFEEGKVEANIESYSLGQTTLEQIFNQFAGSQENPEVAALTK